jgi:hypothetical protein
MCVSWTVPSLVFLTTTKWQMPWIFGSHGLRKSWKKTNAILRLTVGQPDLLSGHNEARDQCFSLKFSVDRVCYFVAPSLMRGLVCYLLLLLGLASAVPLGSEPSGTQDHILFPQVFETSPTWRTRSPYLYSPGTGWPSYTPPGTGLPFRRLLWLAGLWCSNSNPSSTRAANRSIQW